MQIIVRECQLGYILMKADLDMCFLVAAAVNIIRLEIFLGVGSSSLLRIWTKTTPLQPVSRYLKRLCCTQKRNLLSIRKMISVV